MTIHCNNTLVKVGNNTMPIHCDMRELPTNSCVVFASAFYLIPQQQREEADYARLVQMPVSYAAVRVLRDR